jgi:cysteinyl-tRNA synthetase
VAEPLRLFNTLSRNVEEFAPRRPGEVGLYSCGPTVYSYAHIGNMRTYLFVDLLRRTLELFGYHVMHVMNITDVGHLTDDADAGEDKLEVGARREGLDAWAVARKYTEAFFDHAALLGILRPTIVCKATDHIPEQIAMIKALEAKGYVYPTGDGIYFDTARFPAYADFGRLDVQGLQEGHRVGMGDKRSKTDFALWKFSKAAEHRQMEWDSPWGRGFPGWHIECSAMSAKFLGEQFDIHTGGVDHIPIHHTNEIAQSECATGKHPFVKYWLHGEFLVIDDAEKMSKSLGNILTVRTLVDRGFHPLAFRMLVLQSHYRKQLRFSLEILAGAQRGFERLNQLARRALADAGETVIREPQALGDKGKAYQRSFKEALASDLNAPQALAALFALLEDHSVPAGERVTLAHWVDQALGLDVFQELKTGADVPPEMLELLRSRNAARQARQWAEADRLRAEIAAKGYEILDGAEGSSLKRKL